MLEAMLFSLLVMLPAIFYSGNFLFPKRLHALLLYMLTGIVYYGLILVAAWVGDVQATARMNSFDLDGDGRITGAEDSPEAQEAMDDWASDTGRTMAPFLGVPIAAIWVGIWFCVLYAGEWIVRKAFPRDPLQDSSGASGEVRAETGNPYESPRAP